MISQVIHRLTRRLEMKGNRDQEGAVRRRRLPAALAVVLALGTASAADAREALATATPEQRYQLGLEAQTAGEYEQMLAEWRAAAAAGVVEAQEMLAMALLVGPTLYGEAVARELCESLRWMRAAAATGSRVGTWQLLFVSRLRQAPAAGRCDG